MQPSISRRTAVRPLLMAFLLAIVVFPAHPATSTVNSAAIRYPASPFVIDVTQPPYLAKGDGVTDDTGALQAAIQENTGRHRVLFFPKGTYLVSRTLMWPKQWKGRDNWGKTMLRGEDRERTVIRLKDETFTDSRQPRAIMWCGGFGSADSATPPPRESWLPCS